MKRHLASFAGKFGSSVSLICALLIAPLSAEIIPQDRRINWDPGIPGGIPERTEIYTTLTSIDKTGATDVTAAIQSALNSCPAGKVVKLPSGTFRIEGSIKMPSNVTLRGSGSSTVLTSFGSKAGLIQFGSSGLDWNPTSTTTTITGGASAGATSFTVASNSGISVGTYIVVTETNDPSYVSIDGTTNGAATWVDGWNTQGQRARGQIVEVTAVSGTTVSFKPALYSAYTRTPWATRFTAQCKWSGVEDLKTYANETKTDRNFLFQCAAYCWMKNVECDYTDGDHVSLDWSYRCEIRRCYIHDAYIHTSGSFDNMIGLRTKTTACLVIDNIIRRLHVSVMCEWGAAGNVIAYNYDEGNFDEAAAAGNRWLPVSMNSNHGAHPQFNLFEGNVSQKFQADAYWGSSSTTTVFRNYFSGSGVGHPPYKGRGVEDKAKTDVFIQGNRAIDIWELQSTHSVVGNIVGGSAIKARNAVRKVVNPAGRAYDNPPYCFSYGYVSESASGGTALQSPTTTLIEHGNWDVASGTINWDSAIADRSIPASLFLAEKPAWFGDLPFPPIDAARKTTVEPTDIPAGYRYINGIDPPSSGGGGTTDKPPVVSANATPVSGDVPLAVTFSSSGSSDPEGKTITYSWVFGDGGTSTLANPTRTYSAAGTYKARLTVSDGTNTTTSSDITIVAIVPGSDLVAAYGFEEGTGTVVSDNSTYNNQGTISGATWSAGKFGRGLEFNGTNAFVTVPNSASLAASKALTISAWVYPTKIESKWSPILFKPIDATQISYVLQGTSPQSGISSLFISPGTSNLFATNVLPVNTWSHLAATYDGASVRFYVNGVQVSNRAQTGDIVTGSQALTIGGNSLYQAYWSGRIDEVRIYNSALSASRITTDMNTAIKPAGKPLAPENLRRKSR